MKKRDLKILALTGLFSGLCIGNSAECTESRKKQPTYEERQAENTGYRLMTENELFIYLNSKTRELYESLSPEGKRLALKVASARCNGTNECGGLNACRTEKNDCMGEGECKGHGKCTISDKNQAVKLVAKKMAEKRQSLRNRSNEKK